MPVLTRTSLAATLAVAGLLVTACTGSDGATPEAGGEGPYAGLAGRDISSLSDDDVDGLLGGEGLGYAMPAELNDYPGPAHVLQLADELGIDDDQATQIERIQANMRAAARDLGPQLVDAEWQLDEAFRDGTAVDRLDELTRQSAQIEARLRSVHLQAHLETTELLEADQIETYNRLRGYDSSSAKGDPR
jgi:hypothetical protein